MPLFLGIDGGQSSTTAVIGDETGRILGSGNAGPCNHVDGPEGKPKFVNAISGCVQIACAQAGLSIGAIKFEATCGGFSGGPADKDDLLRSVLSAERYEVTNDAAIALSGATGGEPGVIVIAGTGSIALGRNSARKIARAGGWGYLFGDEGGGFDLTRQALRAILRHEEGWGPATSLHEALLHATKASSANDLLHQFYTSAYRRPQIAALSKLVDEAALHGDAVAAAILSSAAQQLALCAAAVRSQLFVPGEPCVLGYVGGVFRSSLLLERFRLLASLDDGITVRPPIYSPALGALLEAYAVAGLAVKLSNVPELKR